MLPVGASSHGRECQSAFFWKPDLLDMEQRLKRLERNRSPWAVHKFCSQRQKLVEQAMRVCENDFRLLISKLMHSITGYAQTGGMGEGLERSEGLGAL